MNLTNIYNKYLGIIKEHGNDSYFGKINKTTSFYFNISNSGEEDSINWMINKEYDIHSKDNGKKYKRLLLSFKPYYEDNLKISLSYIIEKEIVEKKETKIHSSGFDYCFSLVNEETNGSVSKIDNKSSFISHDYDNFEYSEESISFIIDNLNFETKELTDMYNLKFDYEIPVDGLINFLINSIDSIKNFEYKENIKPKPSLK